MVKQFKKTYTMYNYQKEDDYGIWFDEEDPEDSKYKPENCVHIYMSLAYGKY